MNLQSCGLPRHSGFNKNTKGHELDYLVMSERWQNNECHKSKKDEKLQREENS